MLENKVFLISRKKTRSKPYHIFFMFQLILN